VLKIEGKDLPAVVLGDSTKVNVGDTVLAIGNPLGELTFSQSRGSVSSANRAINVDGTPFNMIQVDASINPGNSGGPLMNLYGEVIGIVSAKYSSYADTVVEGLGFAIPISDVQAIITDIMENGQVTGKPYLAITAGTMTEEMAVQYQIDITEGVFVYSVVKDGAGAKAGLRLGDVITKVDDKDIKSMDDLSAAKKGHKAGDTVTVTYYREGEYHTTELTFDEQPLVTEEPQQPQTPQQDQGGQGGYYPYDPFGGMDMFDLYDYFFGRN
jgi:serine protease Do